MTDPEKEFLSATIAALHEGQMPYELRIAPDDLAIGTAFYPIKLDINTDSYHYSAITPMIVCAYHKDDNVNVAFLEDFFIKDKGVIEIGQSELDHLRKHLGYLGLHEFIGKIGEDHIPIHSVFLAVTWVHGHLSFMHINSLPVYVCKEHKSQISDEEYIDEFFS